MLGFTKHDDMPITTHVSAVQALAVTIPTAVPTGQRGGGGSTPTTESWEPTGRTVGVQDTQCTPSGICDQQTMVSSILMAQV